MASLLEGEHTQEVSATLQVEKWLHALRAQQTSCSRSLKLSLLPLKVSNRRLNRSNPHSPDKPFKTSPGRQKENSVGGRGRNLRETPSSADAFLRELSPESADTHHFWMHFDSHCGCDLLRQLKTSTDSQSSELVPVRTLMDWRRETPRQELVSRSVAALVSDLWMRLVSKGGTRAMHNSFPFGVLLQNCAKFQKNNLSITRKCVSHRYSDLFREPRLTMLQYYPKDVVSNRQSQGPSTSVTPIHMRTEGNMDSRSESPQLFTTTFEGRQPTAIATCIGFRGYRMESAQRKKATRVSHPYQDAGRTVFPGLPGLDGPLIRFKGRRGGAFRNGGKQAGNPRRRSLRRTIQPSPVKLFPFCKYPTPQRLSRPSPIPRRV